MNGRGKEYATALFELAAEDGKDTLEEVNDSLDFVTDVMNDVPQLQDYLISPAIPVDTRVGSVEDAFGGEVHDYVLSFMCILTRKGHIRDLGETVKAFREIYKEYTNRSDAVVTSAVELTPLQKDKLHDALVKRTGRDVNLTFKVDRKLIGGLTVETEGTLLDGSLVRRLSDIKEVMER